MKTIKWSNLYVPLVFPLYFYDNWHLLSRQEILQWEATQWTMLSSTFWQWRPFSPHNNRIDKRHEMNPLIRKRHAILKCEQLAFWAAWAWDQALRVRTRMPGHVWILHICQDVKRTSSQQYRTVQNVTAIGFKRIGAELASFPWHQIRNLALKTQEKPGGDAPCCNIRDAFNWTKILWKYFGNILEKGFHSFVQFHSMEIFCK